MFEKQVVIDGRGHIAGRLASYVAKELLNGQRIVVVRTEGLNQSGSLFRNKIKFQDWMNIKMSHKPTRGIQHYRSPARLFARMVRGMLPHKTPRGAAALGKLKTFEGIPAPYDTKKKSCVPDALKIVRLKNHRKFCTLGDIANDGGWDKRELLVSLEEKRRVRSAKYHEKKVAEANRKRAALNLPEIKKIQSELSKLGY